MKDCGRKWDGDAANCEFCAAGRHLFREHIYILQGTPVNTRLAQRYNSFPNGIISKFNSRFTTILKIFEVSWG
jgi:hypothetical protein